MSIGIYAFLRIYFLGFWMSAFAQFRTRSTPPTSPPVRSTPRSLSGIGCRRVQRVQRPGVCVVPCMVCLAFGTVCAAACRAPLFWVRWGAGGTGGVYSRRPAPPGQSRHHRKNKKGSKKSPRPLLSISKIFCKNKKTPTKGLCSVLYLPYKP